MGPLDDRTLARAYHRAVHAAERADVSGNPEAQLTLPVAHLFAGIAEAYGVGRLECIPESQRDHLRPDFAFLLDGRHVGYGELKKPTLSADIEDQTGWTPNQRESLAALDSLVLCNGREARLYAEGRLVGPVAPLPYDDPEDWNPRPLVQMLRNLGQMRGRSVTRVSDLAQRLARRTASLRDRILDLLEGTPPASAEAVEAAKSAWQAWQRFLHPTASEREFADGVAQVIAYGLVMATLQGEPDSDRDGRVTAEEARAWLRARNPVIAACFGPVFGLPAFLEALRSEIAAIEDLCGAMDREALLRSAQGKDHGEPWLYFYEDFLGTYDPARRKNTGVYFTPVEVVSAMVRMVEHLLVQRFGRRLGFADPGVVTLDPATGTGTFLLAVLDAAACTARDERGEAGPAQAARSLAQNLIAFEILPGPYAVAHLRVSQRLRAMDPAQTVRPRIFLTDTLQSPFAVAPELPLFGDAKVMADEQRGARQIKAEQRVTVVIGNPPYRRTDKEGSGWGGGGWVVSGPVPGRKTREGLFEDVLKVAKEHTIFSHHASLYNLYVYFWRWAIWKAFEAHGSGPGIVALITASSWLDGPGFVGLRQVAREVADEGFVLDLGGDHKGAVQEENVFAIETPVAIVVLVRDGPSRRRRPARFHYRRITGLRDEKLAALREIGESRDPLAGPWQDSPTGWTDRLVPPTGSETWRAMPALADLMPWQQPGCMFNRLWPIAPSKEVLERRWREFVASPTEARRRELCEKGRDPGPSRETLFQTAKTGRDIFTRVGDLPPLADLRADAPHRPIVPYGYRAFDRQWTFDDPRLIALDRPALWQTCGPRQVFLVSRTTEVIASGPAMVATAAVPDKHVFRGAEGGKDVFPLYRDRRATAPNVTCGHLEALGRLLGFPTPAPEDLAAYLYAVLSTPAYQRRFAAELRTPGPRVPITREADLWVEAVRRGRRLLWLHTFAERFRDPEEGRGSSVPKVEGLGWVELVRRMPRTPKDIRYDAASHRLVVGDGVVAGVRPEVWAFEVSGMPVVAKWLGYRTREGAGRAAASPNPLDRIRDESWRDEWNDELLDLLRVLTLTVEGFEAQDDLLDRICRGPLVRADDLPAPSPAERAPPSTVDRTVREPEIPFDWRGDDGRE